MDPPWQSVDSGPDCKQHNVGEHSDDAGRRLYPSALKQLPENRQHPFDVEGDEEISGGF